MEGRPGAPSAWGLQWLLPVGAQHPGALHLRESRRKGPSLQELAWLQDSPRSHIESLCRCPLHSGRGLGTPRRAHYWGCRWHRHAGESLGAPVLEDCGLLPWCPGPAASAALGLKDLLSGSWDCTRGCCGAMHTGPSVDWAHRAIGELHTWAHGGLCTGRHGLCPLPLPAQHGHLWGLLALHDTPWPSPTS